MRVVYYTKPLFCLSEVGGVRPLPHSSFVRGQPRRKSSLALVGRAADRPQRTAQSRHGGEASDRVREGFPTSVSVPTGFARRVSNASCTG